MIPIRRLKGHITPRLVAASLVFNAVALCSAVEPPRLSSTAVSVKKTLYTVQPGDTIQSIAEQFMGGEMDIPELMEYNKIERPEQVKEGLIMVLPGADRVEAVKGISRAQAVLDRATKAAAKTYALEEYELAKTTVESAVANRTVGAYDKATALAELGEARAQHAKELADERAVIQQSGRLTAVHGNVEISTDGGSIWTSAALDQELAVDDLIRTDSSARAELTLADESVIQLRESTEFKVADHRLDRRDNKRTSQLQVNLGSVLANVTSRQHKDSKFQVKSRSTILAIRGTNFRLGSDQLDTTRVSLLEGDVEVTAKEEILELPQNYGTFVEANKGPEDPIVLIPAPIVTSIRDDVHTTSLQVLEFMWAHEELISEKGRKATVGRLIERYPSYHFEIAKDDEFNYMVQDHVVAKNYLKTDVLAPGEYFWRISSIDENGLEGPSTDAKRLRIIRNQLLALAADTQPVVQGDTWIIGPSNVINVQNQSPLNSVVNLEYSLNNAGYIKTDGRIFFNAEGRHLLKVRGIGADKVPGEPVSQWVELDRTPPLVEMYTSDISADPGSGDFVFVTFDVIDKTGIGFVHYSIDGGSFVPYNGRFKLNVENPYVDVHVNAKDIFGKEFLDEHFKRRLVIELQCHVSDLVGNTTVESFTLEF